MFCKKQWVLLCVFLGGCESVYAQGRAGVETTRESSGTWKLEHTLNVEGTYIYPGMYKVIREQQFLVVVEAKTMVVKAKVRAQEKDSGQYHTRPRLGFSVLKKQSKGVLDFFVQDRVYTAFVSVDEHAQKPGSSTVVLEQKKKESKVHERESAETEVMQIQKTLKKYGQSVVQCADRAMSVRWETDDPRFKTCVCPIVQKWKLPKITQPKRVHHFLVKKRWGFSFTLSKNGQAEKCRVWAGSKPPKDEDMSAFSIGWMGFVR